LGLLVVGYSLLVIRCSLLVFSVALLFLWRTVAKKSGGWSQLPAGQMHQTATYSTVG
jgi:hypothetical protein